MIRVNHVDNDTRDVQILGCTGLGNVIMSELEYYDLCIALFEDVDKRLGLVPD